jgi:hypothetical protein
MNQIHILQPRNIISVHWIGSGLSLVRLTKWPSGQVKTFGILCALGNQWWEVPKAINDNRKEEPNG